ncbi:class I SAM-dependent methyltransferase [Candidatus Woesearchaeota archaeon]|nr:MAG: class I SAM-dependent methyltransferase [Candidatus Woesearchaeota archaeon]
MSLLERIYGLYERVSPSYYALLRKALKGCKRVVEFGCGDHSPLARQGVEKTMGVDIHGPSLELARDRKTHDIFVQADVRKFRLKRKFDCAIALDVIEHLPKKDGKILLENMEYSARRVVVFTPNGFLEQDQSLVEENPYQAHLSGWTVDDFRRFGYKVYGVNGLKCLRGSRAIIRWRPKIFWFAISEISQWVVFLFPRLAFQLLAVKDVKPSKRV